LKDVIYSLLVQHLTGDSSRTIRRNALSDIDADFADAANAARLASCLYLINPQKLNQLTNTYGISNINLFLFLISFLKVKINHISHYQICNEVIY
jgi:hypothetical protein